MNASTGAAKCVICRLAQLRDPFNRTCDSFDCRQQYVQWLRQRKPVCAICGAPLPLFSGGVPTCGAPVCQTRYASIARPGPGNSLSRCVSCGVYVSRQKEALTFCRDQSCRVRQAHEQQQERKRIEKERYRELVGRAERLREIRGQEISRQHSETFSLAIVPHTSAEMADPDPELIGLFRRRLVEMVNAAIDDPEQKSDWPSDVEPSPAPTQKTELPVFSQACISCRGHCCHQGEAHAFLSVGILRRYVVHHPELSREEVVAAYLGWLPRKSLTDSCIYHTDQGCNLPREMRSDICNQFLCDPLRQVRKEIRSGVRQFFIVSERDGDFHASHFIAQKGDAGDGDLCQGDSATE